jgi:hypothetical protein
MRSSWTATFTAIACAFATGLLAQTAQPAQSTTAKNTVMVTGCLQRAAAGSVGTRGTVDESRPPAEPKFVLTNAATGPLGTVGTSGTTKSATSEYRLQGDDAKFTPHIGHKVEITGVVDHESDATASPATAGRSGGAAASAPKLTVDTVRMVSLTCP